MSVNVDVAIVGFGPGGEVLASLLGQAGHRVVVFDKFPAPYGLPRMSTLDGEIARLLQHAGDAGKALEGSIPQPFVHLFGADDKPAVTFDWSQGLCGHPFRLSLHQPNIESAMQDKVAECDNVDVRWGSEVVAIDDLGDRVRVTARSVDGGEDEHVEATWVVGMDGASSFVRTAVDLPLNVVHTRDDQWYLTDFDILDPDLDPPATEIHMLPHGPYFWGPNGARRCRTDVRLIPGQNPADLADEEHGYRWLEEHLVISREQVRITRRVLYRFRSQFATSYRRGRVLIGGDAAHAMTPYMAQGSCSAMRDSGNLAWKLDLVLTGRAGDALVDTYEEERLSHVIPIVEGSLGTWAMTIEEDEGKAAGRDAFLRSGQAPERSVPGLTTGILHRESDGSIALPTGELSPQGRMRIGDREGLLDDLLGVYGFQLISSVPISDALTDAQRSAAERLGVTFVVLGEGAGHAADLDSTYTTWLAGAGAVAALVRPDFYVFGVADSAPAATSLLDELVEQVGSTATVDA